MTNNKFSIEEALRYGWQTFKSNAAVFIGLTLALGFVAYFPSLIVKKIFEPKSVGLLVGSLLVRILGLVISMIATRIALDFHDQGHVDGSLWQKLAPQFLNYLFGRILYFIVILIGFLLLIVPGFIAVYMFYFAGFLIIDRNMGPVE